MRIEISHRFTLPLIFPITLGNMEVYVYWIRAAHHKDMFSEGYIGVSRNPEKRWKYGHKWATTAGRHENQILKNAVAKYGWDELIKEVLLVADENYCYEIENKLRPEVLIGWNIASGGGRPPITKPRGPDYISPLKGVSRPTPWLVGKPPGTAGKPMPEETKEKIRQANLGKKQSPEQIAKRVESRQKTLELKQNKRSH